MFEDPSSQISKVSNLKFLIPIVLHTSKDKHYYISLLYRIDNPGIHHIICQRLKNQSVFNLREEIPQLIEILLKNDKISHPVYCLLKDNARKDISFRIALFLRLKSVLGTVEESKAEICYYLCCDILQIDEYRNRLNMERYHRNSHINRHRTSNVNAKYLRHYYKTFYYRPLSFKRRSKLPLIEGLMLYFSKAILSVFNTPLFTYLDSFSRVFNSKKNFKNLQFRNLSTPFKKNSHFLEHLVKISVSLKMGSPLLRLRILKIYLEILNREMDGSILDPLDSSRRMIRFSLDHAKVLDSAENCPFIVVFETINKKISVKNRLYSKDSIKKANVLLKQLEVVGDLGDLGDINGIKESLVVAIENVLGRSLYETTIDISDELIKSVDESVDDKIDQTQQESNSVNNKQVNLDILTTNHKYDELINGNDESNLDGSAINKVMLINTDLALPDRIDGEDTKMTKVFLNEDRSLSSIKNKLKTTSKYSSLPGWSISSFIVKSGNILKHEYLAYQVLSQMKEIFGMEGLPIYIRNYQILLISDTAGLVETIDAQSIHRLKFDMKFKTLEAYFQTLFSGEDLVNAKRNFLYSLVGYSLACFILQIKDRHNGNILIDGQGHIIHVDFGFTFGKHPGIISVENAPFKFSSEYLSLIDMTEFKELFIKGFKALRKHREKLSRLVEIMKNGGYFEPFEFEEFVGRLRIFDSEKELEGFCQGLIDRSIRNMRTVFYDQFQYLSNGYL